MPDQPPGSQAIAITDIPVDRLAPDPFQPRREFREAAIRHLADSIARHGVLQPLIVRPMQGPNSAGRYWIVAGERRYRAARSLGITVLPCRVAPYENRDAAVVALAENLHREDLNELEKAEAVHRLRVLTDKTWDEVAEVVDLSRDYVKRLVGLLKLAPEVQEHVRCGAISARIAIALRPLPEDMQVEMAERAVREGLTAEQIRAETHRRKPVPEETPGDQPPGSLRDCAAGVERIARWLDSGEWRHTADLAFELQELEHRVGRLHRQVAALRGALEDRVEEERELEIEARRR